MSRRHWTVCRNQQGWWVPVWEPTPDPLNKPTQAQAQRKADQMNAQEDDYTRQKYAPAEVA